MALSLRSMKPGDGARIVGPARGERGCRRRLPAMGLTPGVAFTLKRVAPLGDPIAISVRNFALTPRRDGASVLQPERPSCARANAAPSPSR